MTRVVYRYRAINVEQAEQIKRAYDRGARVADLASAYGVNRRTVYRTLKRVYLPTRKIVVDDWVATVEIGPEGPVLLTPWLSR